MTVKGWFRLGAVDAEVADALRYELAALRRPEEDRWYWLTAEFVIDLVTPASDPAITLYHVRRPRQPRRAAVILQSDWQGMEFFTVEETKP